MNANPKVPKLISRPFLLLRLVAFVFLLLLNILILSFAAFNITASRTWEKYVSAGPSLAVFNSSVFFFLSLLLLGERKYSHAIPPVSMLLAEVCWVSFMTVLTFLSSVLSTRIGPAKMCSSIPVNMAMCSSSILILPVSWMNFFVFFAYSVTLSIVAILHAPFVPDIWYSAVSDVPWFDFSPFHSEKSDLEHQTIYGDAFRSSPSVFGTKYNGDDGRQTLKVPPRAPWLSLPRGSFALSVSSYTPAWAKQHNAGLTRGLDNPFSRPFNEGSATHHGAPVQHPARAIMKPTFEAIPHERDDDPFAAPSKHDTTTTKVSYDYHDKKRSLQPLAGLNNLFRWSVASTSGECYKDQSTDKRGIDVLAVQNPLDRSSISTVTTTTAVLSPADRKSVSSLFPHDVREEDWNLPLTKPPFRNGRGEGWKTAGAMQSDTPTGRGQGRR